MQTRKALQTLSTNQIEDKLAEFKVPLLSQDHLEPSEQKRASHSQTKLSPEQEVRECVTILRKSRRKAFCTIWTARLSIIVTAATTIFITAKNYLQAGADAEAKALVEENSRQPIKNKLIYEFRNSGCSRCGWDGCDHIPCTEKFPNVLPMM